MVKISIKFCSFELFENSNYTLYIRLLESVAYEFGSNKGMIQYVLPAGKQSDTEEDFIALGFITAKTDAVLLRVESATTQDYMELEIVIIIIYISRLSCSILIYSTIGRR